MNPALLNAPIPAIALAAVILAGTVTPSIACPFCSAVSQTLRQEMEVMDAVVIASCTQSDVTRNHSTGETTMRIEKVLMGDDHIKVGDEVTAVYYGEVAVGRRFMLSGVDPPDLQWSCLPVTERGEAYVIKVAELADADPAERLRYYDDFLQDEETMLARDAYDEFAIAPYSVMKELHDHMDHDQLVEWISDPELSSDRKRLFLTMLGICGNKDDLPMLEKMLRSTKKSTRGGLDALIACYLTLAGEDGLPLIDELFLNNKSAPYADTYAAIMAVRFHGTEGEVIQRSALVESLHYVLDRKDLADLVIPDLARWEDWTQIDRLTDLFLKSDPDNNWIRVPVINYLRACPLDKAKEAIAKLEKVDPESVKRANTFFSIPVPARDDNTQPADSDASATSNPDHSIASVIAAPAAVAMTPGVKLASAVPLKGPQMGVVAGTSMLMGRRNVAAVDQPDRLANLLQLGFVIAVAISTLMIAQFLLLTGGTLPQQETASAMNENT
ncbi:hypothetical protein LF1_32620 [Rubripirellula obstinata]|uniref:Uncharacterized protein n=1 Tax=Rubripirellula obstinata TaxID=406547 RepID=A0A5B1CK90_9BACT|nr:hypothetical protein [Rubripirellula obstinata]KAA1260721.1 hypothetical protein LF1_32620 [Rubripirellula obstinata]